MPLAQVLSLYGEGRELVSPGVKPGNLGAIAPASMPQ